MRLGEAASGAVRHLRAFGEEAPVHRFAGGKSEPHERHTLRGKRLIITQD